MHAISSVLNLIIHQRSMAAPFVRARPTSTSRSGLHKPQEAQLLQRNRAMLRVIEYFYKSLKVTQGHSK